MPECISKAALQEVLDEQIRLWGNRVNQAISDCVVVAARNYTDAYQYIREVFIGSQLPVKTNEEVLRRVQERELAEAEAAWKRFQNFLQGFRQWNCQLPCNACPFDVDVGSKKEPHTNLCAVLNRATELYLEA